MLDEKIKRIIDLALAFQESERIPVCDFLDNSKIFRYFSHTNSFSLKEKVKAYHELGIDVCWQFERRRNYRHEGLLEKLQKFALRKPKFEVFDSAEFDEELDDFKEQQKMFEPYTYLAMSADGILSIAYKALGYEEFSKKMYTELIQLERLIDIFAENLFQRAQRFARNNLGPLFFVNDDIAFNKGLMFSKVFLEQQWMPRIKKSIEPLKENGIKVILHSRGNITEILHQLIDAGIDGIHPIDSGSGMDIGLIKKNYAKNLLLFGNIDLSSKIAEENIEDKIKDCIKKASYNGGHFIGSISGISKKMSLREIFAFFTATKEFGKIAHH